jgi:hypothetical protein
MSMRHLFFLQSLLNDFTSLLQWNRQIYSHNEQNRVENVLPLLREQISTTDGYVSHVSQVGHRAQSGHVSGKEIVSRAHEIAINRISQ